MFSPVASGINHNIVVIAEHISTEERRLGEECCENVWHRASPGALDKTT